MNWTNALALPFCCLFSITSRTASIQHDTSSSDTSSPLNTSKLCSTSSAAFATASVSEGIPLANT
ncbi:hypothetical protein ACHAXM_010974 [Skeletonema potamos]